MPNKTFFYLNKFQLKYKKIEGLKDFLRFFRVEKFIFQPNKHFGFFSRIRLKKLAKNDKIFKIIYKHCLNGKCADLTLVVEM